MKNKLTDFTFSPPGTALRNHLASPQIHSRRSTEGMISDRHLYSPETTIKLRSSPIQTHHQHLLHPNYRPEDQTRSQSSRDYAPVSPNFETLPKSLTYRKESNNQDADSRGEINEEYDYLNLPSSVKQSSHDIQRVIESKGRNIRAEIENLRQQELLLKEKNSFYANNNLVKSGLTVPSGDLLSTAGRMLTSPTSNTSNSRAYAKAMRALQDRIVALEDQKRMLEQQKREEEERSMQLEENFVQIQKHNFEEAKTAKDIENVRNQYLEQIERLQREKEVFLREKEESIREKEQLMNEKEDWIRAKEILEKSLYEKEREKEEAEKKNAPLAENLQKLEKDFAEYKKMYHQHLKSIVLKNEGLVLELSQMKEYYDTQITDFEKELTIIEEENKKKTEEYEATIDGLTKRNKELEELYLIKQKELENAKKQIEAQKLSSPKLDETISRRIHSVPDEDNLSKGPNYESILKSLTKHKKLSSAEQRNSENHAGLGLTRGGLGSGTSTAEKADRCSANESRIKISSFLNTENSQNNRVSELNDLLENYKSPVSSSKMGKPEVDSLIKERMSEERKPSSSSNKGLAGLWTPPTKPLHPESSERLSKTVSNEDHHHSHHRRDTLETIQEKQDDDIRNYLNPSGPSSSNKLGDNEVYIESRENLQSFKQGDHHDDFVNVVYDKLENVETAGFPKNLSFGNADMFSRYDINFLLLLKLPKSSK